MGDELEQIDSSSGFDTNDAMKAFQDVIGTDPDTISQKLIGETLSPEEKREVGPETLGALSLFKDVISGGTLEDVSQRAGEALDQISRRKLELARKLSEGESLTRPQAVAAGFISILPMLIGGAIKGRRGIADGARAGAIGSAVLFKGIKEDNAKTDVADRLEYQDLNNQAKDISKVAVDQINRQGRVADSKELIDYKAKVDPSKGTVINMPKEESKLIKDIYPDYTQMHGTYKVAQGVDQFIAENFAGKEETTDKKGLTDKAMRELAAKDPNSPAAELERKLIKLALAIRKDSVRGATTEKENKLADAVLNGKAFFTSIGGLRNALKDIADEKALRMNTMLEDARTLSQVSEGEPPKIPISKSKYLTESAQLGKSITLKDGTSTIVHSQADIDKLAAQGLI